MSAPVVHFEINGKDGTALQSFYSDLFEWKLNVMPQFNYALVENKAAGAGGIDGGIGESDQGSSVRIFVQVPDLQTSVDKAVQLGATVAMPPTDMGMVQIAMFFDPQGNCIGLVKG